MNRVEQNLAVELEQPDFGVDIPLHFTRRNAHFVKVHAARNSSLLAVNSSTYCAAREVGPRWASTPRSPEA